ncbi:MAG TPA: ATP-binding protein [Gemmatimonadales bacterium]|nr:ATP-binding protein [Gemmatimonadales bacterium]
MQTIRGRLTAWYASAVALTLAAFAAILYAERRSASYQELDRRIRFEADVTNGMLSEMYGSGGVLLQRGPDGRTELVRSAQAAFEPVPGYLLITASDTAVIPFASPDVRAAGFSVLDQLRRLAAADTTGPTPRTARIEPNGPTIRYVVRSAAGGPQFGRVLAGADVESTELGIQELVTPLALVFPFSLLAAWLLGSWIARRALAPVDRIITEVEEISDGRSLHRRLPQPMVKDEFGRLADTLNEMMARLERSFVTLRRFTADASHELKTPLTVLRAGVERAITTPNLPQETLVVLEETLQEVNRMTELVDALLTLARADEGRAPLAREPVDLRSLLREIEETGELLAEPAQIRIEVQVPDHPVTLSVDRSRIRQLALNLVTNAVKYTPAGGRVRLTLAEEPQRVLFAVADTGIGIAPGDLPHIFDRFYQADTARTRTGERAGAGLGLAICRWIAEAHGGSIDVQSRPGRGTTFTVSLPRDVP